MEPDQAYMTDCGISQTDDNVDKLKHDSDGILTPCCTYDLCILPHAAANARIIPPTCSSAASSALEGHQKPQRAYWQFCCVLLHFVSTSSGQNPSWAAVCSQLAIFHGMCVGPFNLTPCLNLRFRPGRMHLRLFAVMGWLRLV